MKDFNIAMIDKCNRKPLHDGNVIKAMFVLLKNASFNFDAFVFSVERELRQLRAGANWCYWWYMVVKIPCYLV
jgi:hypothetical protein